MLVWKDYPRVRVPNLSRQTRYTPISELGTEFTPFLVLSDLHQTLVDEEVVSGHAQPRILLIPVPLFAGAKDRVACD